MKSIVIIEDHSIVRVGVESIIEKLEGFYVLESCNSGAEGLRIIKEKKPDFAIVDLSLPDIQGEVIIRDLFVEKSHTKIIVLTRESYIPQISHLLSLGIRGYILKDNAGRELMGALKSIDEDKTFISPAIRELLVKVGHVNIDSDSNPAHLAESLSQREQQVIRILSQGFDYKQIASKLGISPSTARVHIRNILTKLNLKEAREVIRLKDSLL